MNRFLNCMTMVIFEEIPVDQWTENMRDINIKSEK